MSKFSVTARSLKIICKYLLFYSVFAHRQTWHFFRTIVDAIIRYDLLHSSPEALESTGNIPSMEFADLFHGIEIQPVKLIPQIVPDEGGMILQEKVVLCAICKYIQPANIFEFGTFKGYSTLHMAFNTPDNCKIFTLDIPHDLRIYARYPIENGLLNNVTFIIGEKYQNIELKHKIKQIYSDSVNFDYSQFYGYMDLIFIDGNHQYDNVKSDTENALRMLKPSGIIIWHDYVDRNPGVVKYLNELSKERPLFKIKDTYLVVTFVNSKISHDC